MMKEKRCEICGKATRKFLLKDDQKKIYICSRKCEQEYFETLRGEDKTRQTVLYHLDKKIAKMKKYERFCWVIALLGIVAMLPSIFLTNIPAVKEQFGPLLFFGGVASLTGGLLLTSELSKEKQKLVQKRDQLTLDHLQH